jgi:hypothetical protein
VEYWFNRADDLRCDICLLRKLTSWQLLSRTRGSGGREVTHYFPDEADARRMLAAMKQAAPTGHRGMGEDHDSR